MAGSQRGWHRGGEGGGGRREEKRTGRDGYLLGAREDE